MQGHELLKFMLADQELIDIVIQSRAFNQDYAVRNSNRRSMENVILQHFWKSLDGANFRLTLERKLGGTDAIQAMRGSKARIKDTMLLFICELRRNQHERTRHRDLS